MASENRYGSRMKTPGFSGDGEGMKSSVRRKRGSVWDKFYGISFMLLYFRRSS